MSQDVYQKLQTIAFNIGGLDGCESSERARIYSHGVRDLLSTLRAVPKPFDVLNQYSKLPNLYELAGAFDIKSDASDLFSNATFVKQGCEKLFTNGLWVGFKNLEMQVRDFDQCGIFRNDNKFTGGGGPVEYAVVNGGKVFEGRVNNSPEFLLYGMDLSDLVAGKVAIKSWWLVDSLTPGVSRDSKN